ncbi:cupin domain-containing protein (plasmid) [Mesorhizobium sp. INR15]|nr:cupin domain-containing protein [Mesorhizobium sp. INR15]QPC95392.1 cupin domain-containing protein [Mesorhizobium sp. INR15]
MSADPSHMPTVPYWHLWTDREGLSRLTRCLMESFQLRSMQPPADPQWQGDKTSGRMTTMVTVQPVGWVGVWHENPKPQWIIPLSGRWFVEAMDGTRVEMGPGEFSFGGDQGCRERNGRKGHLSGTVGSSPATLMVVQLEDRDAPAAPCAFR